MHTLKYLATALTLQCNAPHVLPDSTAFLLPKVSFYQFQDKRTFRNKNTKVQFWASFVSPEDSKCEIHDSLITKVD